MNERQEDLKLRGYTLVDERCPAPGTPVMAVAESSRSIAYLDKAGQWRFFRDDSLIGEVLAWKPCTNAALRAIAGLREEGATARNLNIQEGCGKGPEPADRKDGGVVWVGRAVEASDETFSCLSCGPE